MSKSSEVVPPEDTCRYVPPAEEYVLRVVRVGEVGTAAWSSELERRDYKLLLFVVAR